MNLSHTALLRWIAAFKLLKATLLIIAGVGILKMIHKDVGAEMEHWVLRLGLDPGSRHINHAILRVTNLSPGKFRELGIGSFLYAGLFMTEGIGLWLLKHWAEWFTVIITGSLIPVECYEIYRHPSWINVIVLLINIAVVAYLIFRIIHEQRLRRTERN